MKPSLAVVLIFSMALRLAAQDVIINGPSWVDPVDPPDQLPKVKFYGLDYPERLKGSTEIGYLVVDTFVFAQSKEFSLRNFNWSIQYVGTDPLFYDPIDPDKGGKWRADPAMRNGKPVDSLVRHIIIFNPACANVGRSDATPRLLNVVVPELPGGRDYKKNGKSPVLHVKATVDASGQVTKAVAEAGAPDELGQLAEAAVLKWSFAPARKNGQPVTRDVRVPVVFLKQDNIDAAVDTPPHETYAAPVEYSIEMQRLNLRGVVQVGFTVDIEGRVRNPIVMASTNPAFNQAAIDALLKSHFEPALRNGVPVNAYFTEPIHFRMHDIRTGETGDDATAISDHVDQSRLPPALRYDIPAKPANVVYPVYPFELLRDDVSGTAEAVYYVSPGGKAVRATVVKATRPEFGQAVLAMLDQWRFKPAMKDGKPTWTVMYIKQGFSEYSDDVVFSRDQLHEPQGDDELHVPVSDEELHLLHELKKEQPALCPIKDLDAPPQLLSPQPPVFPSALVGKATEGQAVVEFLIDHDGNVQLPRVISATAPAFGYAAVQGVSEWKFAALTSHGRPVDVRARIPIKFTLSL